jgi:hypothetical protein
VLAFKQATGDTAALEKVVPLLAGKTSQGAVTTYICQNFTCQAPLVGVEALRNKLQAESAGNVRMPTQ